MAITGNPYQMLGEEALRKKYSEAYPDLELLKRKFIEIYNRNLWASTGNVPFNEYQKLRKDVSDYLDELIMIQECLGAAITAVNNQNKELGMILKTN
ncbi:hypothetical protein SteCoe_8758 [Stentor coeruleus]|uniref:Uncharacterized protein n=1 Tax=Stentor coeruleus TaxID=5963 RepID=A0A1R2CJC3_9CILI|nr:hypothetical protein SteCoe_8758 [Stentor coeruleus]